MTEIPGWAYILIGSVVSGFSWFVEHKTGQKMILFFYIGLLFVAIGFGKLIYRAVFTSPAQKKSNAHPHSTPLRTHYQPTGNAGNHGNTRQQTFQQQHSPHNPAQAPQHHVRNSMQQQSAWQKPNEQHTPPQQFRMPEINGGNHHLEHKTGQQKDATTANHASIISCPACGVRHYDYANFCMMCGRQMRR